MQTIYSQNVQLVAKQDWLCDFIEKTESDRLMYVIKYKQTDEGKIVFAKLTGNGASKMVHLNLNTNKGIKTGEFINNATFANIHIEVDCIRLYSEVEIEFDFTVFKN